MATQLEPVIYTYFDFKRFLKDRQKWIKSKKPVFTLEYIATQLGFKSKGHVSLVLKGSKSIPPEKIELYADVFTLTGKEKEFFILLVQYNQEKTYRVKKKLLDQMVILMRISDKKLVPTQYKLCEQWYFPIVLEIIRVNDFSAEWSELAKMVIPEITAKEAKNAIEVLQEINLVKKNEHGFWEPTDSILTFGDNWSSVVGREFQIQSIERAVDAIVNTSVDERDISTLTVSMGEESFHQIKSNLKLFRKEVLGIVQSDNSSNRVYQMNLSFFPVSKNGDSK
jgi:uncharacterized protein (TIGR02147 family)